MIDSRLQHQKIRDGNGGRHSIILLSFYMLPLFFLFMLNQFQLFKVFYFISGILLGFYYLKKSSAKFIAYTVILFMISPLIRRIIDWRYGVDSNSLVLLTPSIVSIICIINVIRDPLIFRRAKYLPYVLALFGVTIGFIVGYVNNGLLPASYDLLAWISPIMLSIYVISNDKYEHLTRAFVKTIVLGAMYMGIYAVIQYVLAPPWDTAWLVNSGLTSQGRPAPYSLRVWSTMNSAGVYAVFAMAGLLLTQFVRPYLLPLLYTVGLLGIGLSLVRTAWIGLVLGLLVFLYFQKISDALKYGLIIVTLFLVSYFSLINTPFYSAFSNRISTLGNIQKDGSFKDRQEIYITKTNEAIFNVVGDGLGSVGLASKLTTSNSDGVQKGFDSGVLNTLNSLGWFGTYLYLIGLIGAVLMSLPDRKFSSIASALFAISLVCIVQLFSYSSNVGVQGFLIWVPLALSLGIKLRRSTDAKI